MSRIDPGIDHGDSDAFPRDAQLVPHSIRANQRHALIQEVAELAVGVGGPQPGESQQGKNLRVRASHPDHGEHAEPRHVDARAGHGGQVGGGRDVVEGEHGLNDLSERSRLKHLLQDRINGGGGDDRLGQWGKGERQDLCRSEPVEHAQHRDREHKHSPSGIHVSYPPRLT